MDGDARALSAPAHRSRDRDSANQAGMERHQGERPGQDGRQAATHQRHSESDPIRDAIYRTYR